MQQHGGSPPAGGRVLRVAWPFVPVVIALALFCVASVDLLSASRAFISAESLWTKGQKAAVLHLLRFAETRQDVDFDAYRMAIALPLGDAEARVALERVDDFDRDKAFRGLIAGGNHPDDIPAMIRLYRYFRNVTEIDRAIALWAEADRDIHKLDTLANTLRERAADPACDEVCLKPIVADITEIDARLTPLEIAFSYSIGNASRRVRDTLLWGGVGLAVLLLLSAVWLAYRILRQERQLREALTGSEERLKLAVAGSSDGLWDWHPHRGELYFSPRCAEMLGYDPDELPHARETLLALMHPADVPGFERQLSRHLREGTQYDVEFRLRRKTGGYQWVRSRGRMVRGTTGKPARMAGSLTDITDRKEFESQLFAEKERAQVTLQAIGEAVVTTDVWGRIESLNPVAELLTGWTNQEAIGTFLAQTCPLQDESTGAPITDLISRALQERWPTQAIMLLARRGGGLVAVKPSVALIRDRSGLAIGVVLVMHDVSMERAHAARLAHEATHDGLTGLVNRAEFERRLASATSSTRQTDCTHTLMYLDLDQFKVVNDTCGHAAGDELIRQVAEVMRQALRKGDTLARLGGDEFGVLLEHCSGEEGARVAEALRRAISSFRFAHRQRTFALGVSIGVVSLDGSIVKVEEALSAADAACYMAKEGGRNRVQIYRMDDNAMQSRRGEMEWVSRVHAALAAGRFCLYAQEIVALQSDAGRADQADSADEADAADQAGGRHIELLLRLIDERGELVPPMAFVPACERFNLMPMIDRWVVETSFAALARLHADQPGAIAMCSINLSGASLADDHFPAFVQQQAELRGLALDTICFEITETAAIANLTQAATFIQQLQAMGCAFALDDFGAGMSSFAYLKHLPAAYLKIDGSFVREMLDDPVNLVMIEAIQRIGQAMGKRTIAEFVESEEMLQRLRGLGIDHAQGYYIARPQPFARGTGVQVETTERFAVTL
ncbi:EAL domain-containing protein [Cupriavidus plantarum]|uniref:EAL domain-containing protein n=1 Tax=Cupriavidus plantarum TaxID=942865 RepID=UPI00339D5F1A